MTASTIMPPPRRGCSRCSRRDHVAVIAAEDDYTRAIAGQVEGMTILRLVGRCEGPVALAGAAGSAQCPECRGRGRRRARASASTIRSIARALVTYPGLPHRMERVAERNGVLFVNDSKATNPTSTAPALAAYPPSPNRGCTGSSAASPSRTISTPCEPYFDHVRAAYTIGEAGPMFAATARRRGCRSPNAIRLEKAVGAAAGRGPAGRGGAAVAGLRIVRSVQGL